MVVKKRPISTKRHKDSIAVTQIKDRLQELIKPADLAMLLHKYRHLSRSEFDAKVIELGYQAALLKLSSSALSSEVSHTDTKALDLFLKRCDQYFNDIKVAPVRPKAEDLPFNEQPRKDRTPG